MRKLRPNEPCNRGHIGDRGPGGCRICARARAKAFYWADPEPAKACSRERYLADPEADKKRVHNWCEENRERRRGIVAKSSRKNQPTRTAKEGHRRARKLQATPPGTDMKANTKIYQQCAWISMASGIEHEVDHGVPLKHELVCGLHVPANLRIIAAADNRLKSNSFSPNTRTSL